VAHALLTALWSAVLVRTLPPRHPVLVGAAAGAAIHIFDMELVGRRLPALRALPRAPQLADHLAFGALVGLATRRGSAR